MVTSLSAGHGHGRPAGDDQRLGFGAAQGNGYVRVQRQRHELGRAGQRRPRFTIDSWSDTAITFTVPTPSGTNGAVHVNPGTDASVQVITSSSAASDEADLQITPMVLPDRSVYC